MRELSGKVAFVTGGASGIGLAIARALAEKGMKIALADIDETALDTAARLLSSLGAAALPLHMDVRDPAAWTRAAARAEAELGAVRVLCSNAGVAGSRLNLTKVEPEAWMWTFDINVHGVFHGLQTFVPRMCASGEEGHIVVTSSLGGLLGLAHNTNYCATKAAVIAMCEGLREELSGTRVGVSVLCPSTVNTPLITNTSRLAPKSVVELSDDGPEFLDHFKLATDPMEIGRFVARGIEENRFWLFTHPELKPVVQRRFDEILTAMVAPAPR